MKKLQGLSGRVLAASFALCLFFVSCSRVEEISLYELDGLTQEGLAEILARTVSQPWQGEEFVPGQVGGTWHSVTSADPRSFNLLISEQDSATRNVVMNMHDFLLDYDVVARRWVPRVAAAEVVVNEEAGTLDIIFTLRDDLYWSYYNSDRRVRVTSDDVIFWYDEIVGYQAFGSSGFHGQFIAMPDGSLQRVTINRVDDRTFFFRFPRIVAEPHLASNMTFGPRHIFEPAKREGGVEGVRNLFNVSVDPRTIPSMGQWFLVEYTPGQRLVYRRNPDYWRRNVYGVSIPYIAQNIVRIIPDENTQLLLFRDGQTDSYQLRPQDLDGLLNRGDGSFTVFNAEGSLGAPFWTFNQNPVNRPAPQYDWFTQQEFRQAMSSLVNRDRINMQVFRGLAEPKVDFFPPPNPFYNPDIRLRFLFDPARAKELLASIGIQQDSAGVMRDDQGRAIEFDITIRSESAIFNDTATIIMDELARVGIRVNVRVVDFQRQVEMLFSTFDWDSTLIALSGSNMFPSQGSNVWPSSGNLHMWHPNQPSPATEWEARIDYLFNEGRHTVDVERSWEIWNEFQTIILEQLPKIYLMRPRSFWGLRNRWDFSNVFFDNLNGAEITHLFLAQ
ncbi:MAG: ABC transporter substrate-binding protein [Spirochaetes bacterium]|nr:ABC transporter substrate-binding protein [Spirochaetota bacterium]